MSTHAPSHAQLLGGPAAATRAPTSRGARTPSVSWILALAVLLLGTTPGGILGQVRSEPPAETAEGPPERSPGQLGPGSAPDRWVEHMIVGGLVGGAAGALIGHGSGDDTTGLFDLDRGQSVAVLGVVGAVAGALLGVAAARWGGVVGPSPAGGASLFVRPPTGLGGGVRLGASVPMGGR